MTAPETRVGSLVAEGRLTPEEGERLYRALQRKDVSGWTPLLSPVERLRPPMTVALAILVVVASIGISQLGVRFDGVIGIHRVNGTPSWRTAAIDQLIAVPLLACLFWIASLVVWRRGRLQDFLVATAIGRIPVLLLCGWSLIVMPEMPPRSELLRMVQSGELPVRMLVSSLGSLPLFLWMLFWLYRGFAFASGSESAKAVGVFVVTLGAGMALGELAVRWLL